MSSWSSYFEESFLELITVHVVHTNYLLKFFFKFELSSRRLKSRSHTSSIIINKIILLFVVLIPEC